MIHIAENIKRMREKRNISQEKLAQYLGVSFQAVSKWENGIAYPDIAILPDIARYFAITVDELLNIEKIDEERLLEEYVNKAEKLFEDRKYDELLALWKEAYKSMPNSIEVKEYLMSAYFDSDCVKYLPQIVELGTEIIGMNDENTYYRGQAIAVIARAYAEKGDKESAIKWANKADSIVHNKDSILMQINEGAGLLENYKFIEYWSLKNMFYSACRIYSDTTGMISRQEKQKIIDMVIGFGELFLKESITDDDTSLLFGTKDEIQNFLYTLRNIWNEGFAS